LGVEFIRQNDVLTFLEVLDYYCWTDCSRENSITPRTVYRETRGARFQDASLEPKLGSRAPMLRKALIVCALKLSTSVDDVVWLSPFLALCSTPGEKAGFNIIYIIMSLLVVLAALGIARGSEYGLIRLYEDREGLEAPIGAPNAWVYWTPRRVLNLTAGFALAAHTAKEIWDWQRDEANRGEVNRLRAKCRECRVCLGGADVAASGCGSGGGGGGGVGGGGGWRNSAALELAAAGSGALPPDVGAGGKLLRQHPGFNSAGATASAPPPPPGEELAAFPVVFDRGDSGGDDPGMPLLTGTGSNPTALPLVPVHRADALDGAMAGGGGGGGEPSPSPGVAGGCVGTADEWWADARRLLLVASCGTVDGMVVFAAFVAGEEVSVAALLLGTCLASVLVALASWQLAQCRPFTACIRGLPPWAVLAAVSAWVLLRGLLRDLSVPDEAEVGT